MIYGIYIVNAANSFEFIQGVTAIDVRTGQPINFCNYGQYADWVCSYFEAHSGAGKKQHKKVLKNRGGNK